MDNIFKKLVRSIFGAVGAGVTSAAELQRLREKSRRADWLEFALNFPDEQIVGLLRNFAYSKSQLYQDLFVLAELGFKRNGFFVEFGATNGVGLSNTYMLEKQFGWGGILAEPAKCWHSQLVANRSAVVENKCVWSVSGETLRFNEVDDPELSTVKQFSSRDLHGDARKSGTAYDVETISLSDMLDKHGAPACIDYLSIDTEGSEFEILRNFDFDRYGFRVVTCEHNYTPMREKIFSLLTSNGYQRKYEEMSRFDDWYVRADV